MGFLSDEEGSLGLGWFNLGLCCFQRNVDITATLAATYTPDLTFSATGGVSPGGSMDATYTPDLTFAGVGTVLVSGTMDADYEPVFTFAASGSVGDDLLSSGTLDATYSPTLTFAGTGEIVAPVLVDVTYTDNNDGTFADLALSYTGFVTGYRVYLATGDATLSVTAAQLYAGSGGTGSIEFDDADIGTDIDLTGFTSASTGAVRIAAVLARSADGSAPSNVVTEVVSGLDFTVPAAPTAATDTAGDTITLTFAEAVYGTQDTADFVFTGITAGTPTITGITGFGTSTLTIEISTNLVANGDTVTLAYTNTDSDIRDADGNLLANFTGLSVTNNVPASGNSISSITGAPTNTQAGGDEIYEWNASGSFVADFSGTITYLIVAGGGGGGGSNNFGGGGGGAGGFLSGTFSAVSGQTYNVSVGAGGAGGTSGSPGGAGTNGGTSGITTGTNAPGSATGGGGGGGEGIVGVAGGSGGGGGHGGFAGGSGTGGQGNNGGGTGSNEAGGGGGASAAGGAGDTGSPYAAGDGGAGTANSITGASVTYAGGGGGGAPDFGGPTGAGGAGGGGGGGSNSAGVAGTDGLGGGGGGGSGTTPSIGGAGGDGVVIIRFTP